MRERERRGRERLVAVVGGGDEVDGRFVGVLARF
jgi:hypothetical protein